MKNKKWIFEKRWLIFYFDWGFDLSYELCGYFDARHRINIQLLFFRLTLILPIWSKYTDECSPPEWGISYHHQTLWITYGGEGNWQGGNKSWAMYMPWQFTWVRTSCLKQDGSWEHERPGDRQDFFTEKWKGLLWRETYPYVYALRSGEKQLREATLRVEEREWRWNWFQWLPFPRRVRKTIQIDFDDEVGEQTGSWKGGTVGCSYPMLPGELPEQTLRRMEKERKF